MEYLGSVRAGKWGIMSGELGTAQGRDSEAAGLCEDEAMGQ
jgi:hypothetical protein